jgi:hypothetical protein
LTVTDQNRLPAIIVKEFGGGWSDDKKHALIHVIRENPSPQGQTAFNLAVPMEGLPKVLSLVLKLMEPTLYPDGKQDDRGCFGAEDVELSTINDDGRQVLTFEMSLGGRISFVLDNGQARILAEGLAHWLAVQPNPPTSGTRH